jgi:hypothetical protein
MVLAVCAKLLLLPKLLHYGNYHTCAGPLLLLPVLVLMADACSGPLPYYLLLITTTATCTGPQWQMPAVVHYLAIST